MAELKKNYREKQKRKKGKRLRKKKKGRKKLKNEPVFTMRFSKQSGTGRKTKKISCKLKC